MLDRAVEGAVRDLRAPVAAFEGVASSRAGLSAADLLMFWVPEVAVALEQTEDLLEGVDADPATVRSFQDRLDVAWTLGAEEA